VVTNIETLEFVKFPLRHTVEECWVDLWGHYHENHLTGEEQKTLSDKRKQITFVRSNKNGDSWLLSDVPIMELFELVAYPREYFFDSIRQAYNKFLEMYC
jgi:hypothetical protein